MKQLLTLLIIFSFTTSIFSQQENYKWRIGVSGGYSSYIGDLNSNFFSAQPQFLNPLDNLDLTSQAFSIEHTPNNALGLKLLVANGVFTANDRALDWNGDINRNAPNFDRALNAKTEFQDLSLMATYFVDNGKLLKRGSFIAPYIGLGVGVTNFNVFADLLYDNDKRYYYWQDGTIRDAEESSGAGNIIEQDGAYETDVTALKLEGVDYSSVVLNIPLSVGLKFRVTDAWNINLELSGRYTATDYLDDVSGFYNLFTDEFKNYAGNPSSIKTTWRGNQGDNLNDIYGTVSIGVHYSFGKKLDAFLPPVFYTETQSPLLPQVDDKSSTNASLEKPSDVFKDSNTAVVDKTITTKPTKAEKKTILVSDTVVGVKEREIEVIDTVVQTVEDTLYKKEKIIASFDTNFISKVDTQSIVAVETTTKLDTTEELVVKEIEKQIADTLYKVEAKNILVKIDTQAVVSVDTQLVKSIDSTYVIDTTQLLVLDTLNTYYVYDTTFSDDSLRLVEKIDTFIKVDVDTQVVFKNDTIYTIDISEYYLFDTTTSLKIDSIYTTDSLRVIDKINTITKVELDTQKIITIDTTFQIDTTTSLVLNTVQVAAIDTVFSEVKVIEKIEKKDKVIVDTKKIMVLDTITEVKIDTQEVQVEVVERSPQPEQPKEIVKSTIDSSTAKVEPFIEKVDTTTSNFVDIFKVDKTTKIDTISNQPTTKTDVTQLSNKPKTTLDNDVTALEIEDSKTTGLPSVQDTLPDRDTTVLIVERDVNNGVLLNLLNTRKEVQELTTKAIENTQQNTKDSLQLLYLESQIKVLSQELEEYQMYNNSVAIRANDDYNLAENEQIRLMTDSLKIELERVNTLRNMEQKEAEAELESIKKMQVEAAMKAQTLEREIQKIEEREAKKLEKEAKKAERQANKPTENWAINKSRLAENQKDKNTENNDSLATTTDIKTNVAIAVDSTTKDSIAKTQQPSSNADSATVTTTTEKPVVTKDPAIDREAAKKLREVEVKHAEQIVKKNEMILEKQATIIKQEQEIATLRKKLDQLEKQANSDKNETSNENQVLQQQIDVLNKKMDELLKATTEPKPKVEVKPTPVIVEKTDLANLVRGYEKVNIYFDNGKTTISQEFYNRLDKVASLMMQHSELEVSLQGFTDKSGNPELNFRLSKARANAVKTYLMRRGVNENRITIDYFGDSRSDKKNDPLARRVEVILRGY